MNIIAATRNISFAAVRILANKVSALVSSPNTHQPQRAVTPAVAKEPAAPQAPKPTVTQAPAAAKAPAAKPGPAVAKGSANLFNHFKKVGFYPKTIIDVGVARGTPAIYDAYPDAYYLLIDPVREYEHEFKRILENLSGEYHLCAVSSENGEMEMMVQEPFYISSFHFEREKLANSEKVRKVPVRTIDSILGSGNYDSPIMLKTDAQGHDLDVILGARHSLPNIEVIICELPIYGPWGGGNEFKDYVIELDKLGYRFYDIWGELRRPKDQRLQHLDLVFVKTDGLLRQNKLFLEGQKNLNYFADNWSQPSA